MMVGDDQIDAVQATAFKPGEEVQPAAFRLAVSQLQPQHLAVPVLIGASRNQGTAAGAYPTALAHLDHVRIHDEEGVALLTQVARIPGLHQRIQPLA
jgi:hypothetical protein